MKTHDVSGFIRAQLALDGTQWNLGTFGAIAEFTRDPGEAVVLIDEPSRLGAVTARGGIGFGDLSGVRLFASESAIGRSWSHRVALCLPTEACAMNRRSVLTELGPDEGALREKDRSGILFDMGLATLQADISIRTANPALIEILRAQEGRSLFDPGNPAMGAILTAGPHRVFMSRFGRCEVYQAIPPADGRSPEGPHTHVLPKLLRSGRTHAATEQVPDGFVPCAHLVPAHPLKDGMGRARPWDASAHHEFQAILVSIGDPSLAELRREVLARVAAGKPPGSLPAPEDRIARHAVKVALRQLDLAPERPATLPAWLAAFDNRPGPEEADGEDEDAYGHA